MPTFLVHGFRWPRPLVRIHIILNDLEDAAAEWLMARDTGRCLREDLVKQHPDIMKYLPDIQFVEQYDPSIETSDAKSQPYAYVADIVHEVKLGIDIDEVRGKGVNTEAWGAMVDLRDKLAPGEKVAWFVVVCGDIERGFPSAVQTLEREETQLSSEQTKVPDSQSESTVTSRNGSGSPVEEKKKSRFTKLFRSRTNSEKSIRRTKSNKSLNDSNSRSPSHNQRSNPIPPLPNARQIEKYDNRNHSASSGVQSPPYTGNGTSQQRPINNKSIVNAQAVPRAGILPSPPVSALPSPAYPSHNPTTLPPRSTQQVSGGKASDASSANLTVANQTLTSSSNATASQKQDLPLRHFNKA